MSVPCPRCHSLVATDAITGVPPEYCPYCDGPIPASGPAAPESDAPATDAGSAVEADTPIEDPAGSDDHTTAIATDADAMAVPGHAVADTDAAIASGAAAEDTAAAVSVAGQEAPPEEMPASMTAATTDAASPGPSQQAEADASVDATPTPTEPAAVAAEASATTARPRKRIAPSFVRRRATPNRPTPRRMWLIAAALALLAVVQIVLADRAQLAENARWRPMVVSACNVLHCNVPPWREPSAFAMLGRDVRQHPYLPGALRVDASFRNNARWSQPWPELTLTLSDIDGRALGMRTFSPREYLDRQVTQKEIGSGQVAAIRMEVMEPAAGVVSFSFDFH